VIEMRTEVVTDQTIMSAYLRIGNSIVKELEDMTVGERVSLFKELCSMEQTMACIGLKRLFMPELEVK
jgi:hypothetical protein